MLDPILDLLSRRAWPAVAAAVILLLARAAKAPAIGSPFARVPVRYRPHVVLVLGVLSGALEAVVRGVPLGDALLAGALSAACAVLLHGVAGGVNPQPIPTEPPPPAVSGERPVEAPPVVEPSQAWGPRPSGSGS